jgi:nucleoside-triphosphatase
MGQTILLTGPPRVGKTTIIQRVVERLSGQVGGFYTAEIRERGRRQGFKIITLDGQEGVLAHVGIKVPHRVSKYGVDVAGFEAVGVTALRRAIADADYIIIDEIGKMELFSPAFREAVREAIESPATVLGTVMLRPHPWADAIKRHPRVTLLRVTPANRGTLADEILAMLQEA